MATPPDKGRSKLPGSGEIATQEATSQQSLLSRGPQLQRGRSTGGRSTLSIRRGRSPRPPESKWDVVKSSVMSGTLQLVGLKQSKEEELHWMGVQKSIHINRARKKSPSMQSLRTGTGGVPSMRPQMSIRSTVSREEAPVAHITRYGSVRGPTVPPAGSLHRRIQSDGGASKPHDLMHSLSVPGGTLGRQADKYTGRNQAVRTELKPDLWKVAFQGVRQLANQSLREREKALAVPGQMRSFVDLEEEDEEEETDTGPVAQPVLATIAERDENFFGTELQPLASRIPREETDSAVAVGPRRVETDAAVARLVPPR